MDQAPNSNQTNPKWLLVLAGLLLLGGAVAATWYWQQRQINSLQAQLAQLEQTTPEHQENQLHQSTSETTFQLNDEKLGLRLINGWGSVVSQSNGSASIVLSHASGWQIHIDLLRSAAGKGTGGEADYNVEVDKFKFGSTDVYLLDTQREGKQTQTVISNCSGSKKCLVESEKTDNYIDVYISYDVATGQPDDSPDPFDPSDPIYRQALDIVKSLSYQ